MFEEKKIRDLLLDEEKVEDLVRKYYSDIYKYCFFHLGNKETAQDITQDVFLKFLKSFVPIWQERIFLPEFKEGDQL